MPIKTLFEGVRSDRIELTSEEAQALGLHASYDISPETRARIAQIELEYQLSHARASKMLTD